MASPIEFVLPSMQGKIIGKPVLITLQFYNHGIGSIIDIVSNGKGLSHGMELDYVIVKER